MAKRWPRLRLGADARPAQHANLLYHRGVALYGLRRFEEALTALDASLSVLPDVIVLCPMRGIVLAELGRLNEALVCDTRAIAPQPRQCARLCEPPERGLVPAQAL